MAKDGLKKKGDLKKYGITTLAAILVLLVMADIGVFIARDYWDRDLVAERAEEREQKASEQGNNKEGNSQESSYDIANAYIEDWGSTNWKNPDTEAILTINKEGTIIEERGKNKTIRTCEMQEYGTGTNLWKGAWILEGNSDAQTFVITDKDGQTVIESPSFQYSTSYILESKIGS